MRFVDVNPYFYPYKGGIERRMHDTARLLASRGHDVTILTARLPDTPEEEKTEWGYRVVRLPSRFIDIYNPPYVSSKGVLETLESMDPDTVNYNYRWAPSYNKALKRYDGRKVFTYHNMWGEGIGLQASLSEINDNAFRKTLDTFDHIVCVSDYVRSDLIRRGIPADSTTTVPTCMDMPTLRKKPEGDFILSLGRLVATKGLHYLIDAMDDIDCRLILCGKGPEEEKLRRRIERKGLGSKVEMRGYVSEEEKADLIDSCRLFVMPSLFESFGLAALEVMSHGKPLVYSGVNGLPETVGEGGLAVPPHDSAAISEAVNSMLRNDTLRMSKGLAARKKAETYTWPNHIGTLERILLGNRDRLEYMSELVTGNCREDRFQHHNQYVIRVCGSRHEREHDRRVHDASQGAHILRVLGRRDDTGVSRDICSLRPFLDQLLHQQHPLLDLRGRIRIRDQQAVRVPQQILGTQRSREGREPVRRFQDIHWGHRMGPFPRTAVDRPRSGLPGIRKHVDQDRHEHRGDRPQLGSQQASGLQTRRMRRRHPALDMRVRNAVTAKTIRMMSRRAHAVTNAGDATSD